VRARLFDYQRIAASRQSRNLSHYQDQAVMGQEPLHLLMVEPRFPGRLGHIADWLVRKRGYRCYFYAHQADRKEVWPRSVGNGLDLQIFGVGGVARDVSVPWSRILERSLCYAYGCWEVLEQKRPRPVDVIMGRSTALGSSLFAPVLYPAAPLVTFLDYYYHPKQNDLADEAGPGTPSAYYHWRRSMAAIDLLDLENSTIGWTPTGWQRSIYPAEYQEQIHVGHDGIDARRFSLSSWHKTGVGPRSIAGRSIADSTFVVTFVAQSVDKLRGFDRFLSVAETLLKANKNVVCVVVGNSIVQRGLDVEFHNQDYAAHLLASRFASIDKERLWFLGLSSPATVAEVLAASDLHLAPCRPYPVARSLLEAMASGCVVIASDTDPHREVIQHGQTGLLAGTSDPAEWSSLALAVMANRGEYQPIGLAAANLVRDRFSEDACLPKLAERLSSLVSSRGTAS
jgi:glycosyltransferase involved in cell wall biosynthesis